MSPTTATHRTVEAQLTDALAADPRPRRGPARAAAAVARAANSKPPHRTSSLSLPAADLPDLRGVLSRPGHPQLPGVRRDRRQAGMAELRRVQIIT